MPDPEENNAQLGRAIRLEPIYKEEDVKITAWVLQAPNGQIFGPFTDPQTAIDLMVRTSGMFVGPLRLQPVLELPDPGPLK